MLNRWLGIASITVMLAANAALLLRDVVPNWTAGDPPVSGLFQLGPNEQHWQQVGIFDGQGRIGTSWTKAEKTGELLNVCSWTRMGPPDGTRPFLQSRWFIRGDLFFNPERILDHLMFRVSGNGGPMSLEGNFVVPNDFACKWELAKRKGEFIVPADLLRVFSDATRPFDNLTNLRVGQTWRMQVFNPLAGLMPGGNGAGFSGGTIVARVTGQENLFHGGENVSVFIVEAERARAWVAPDGRVLQQEIELPVLGALRLVDEPFDHAAQQQALHED